MGNDKFKKALYDALIPEYTEVMRGADDTEHEFSPEFEKRMNKLIKRRSRFYYRLINTLGKQIACIAVIIFVVSSVAVIGLEAFKNNASDFIITVSKNQWNSIIQSAHSDDPVPQTIEELYDITYDLSEYEVVYDERKEHMYWKRYIHETEDYYYTIELKQYDKKTYVTVFDANTEITTVDINGHNALYYFRANYNSHVLIWDNGEYVIYLSSNSDKNTAIKMAESVKKVEQE